MLQEGREFEAFCHFSDLFGAINKYLDKISFIRTSTI